MLIIATLPPDGPRLLRQGGFETRPYMNLDPTTLDPVCHIAYGRKWPITTGEILPGESRRVAALSVGGTPPLPPPQIMIPERQRPHAPPRDLEHGLRDRGGDLRDRLLADAGNPFVVGLE